VAVALEPMQFFSWYVASDRSLTARFSKAGVADRCRCVWCRNWIAGRRTHVPFSTAFALRRLGIRLTAESDVYQQALADDGVLYRAVYWCVGKIISGEDCWTLTGPGTWTARLKTLRSWPNYIAVGVSAEGRRRLESPGWAGAGQLPLLQIEMRVVLPWLLEEPLPSSSASVT
jgi:hypothetical protein